MLFQAISNFPFRSGLSFLAIELQYKTGFDKMQLRHYIDKYYKLKKRKY